MEEKQYELSRTKDCKSSVVAIFPLSCTAITPKRSANTPPKVRLNRQTFSADIDLFLSGWHGWSTEGSVGLELHNNIAAGLGKRSRKLCWIERCRLGASVATSVHIFEDMDTTNTKY